MAELVTLDTLDTRVKELELTYNLILDAIKYSPYIYSELSLVSNPATNNRYIKHKLGYIDRNAILFFVPSVADASGEDQFLMLIPPEAGYDLANVAIKRYLIKIETTSGTYENAQAAHLIPGHLTMFRLLDNETVSIVNYTHRTSITTADLTVTEQLKFVKEGSRPQIKIGNQFYNLMSSKDLEGLFERVNQLEKRIVIGTEEPADALSDADEGTIYMKVEYYGSNNT